jgi:hypothetical protein
MWFSHLIDLLGETCVCVSIMQILLTLHMRSKTPTKFTLWSSIFTLSKVNRIRFLLTNRRVQNSRQMQYSWCAKLNLLDAIELRLYESSFKSSQILNFWLQNSHISFSRKKIEIFKCPHVWNLRVYNSLWPMFRSLICAKCTHQPEVLPETEKEKKSSENREYFSLSFQSFGDGS